MLIRTPALVLVCLSLASVTHAQTDPNLQSVLERLDKLEQQNQTLLTEIRQLRQQLTAAPAGPVAATASPAINETPPPAERLDVQERRTEELAQTKVGTSQRMPVTLTGMLLFNAFHNGGFGGALQYPLTAQLTESAASTGATFRQTIIGLRFDGPTLPGGGKLSGIANFDFWGGTASPGNNLFRIRTAAVDLAWKNTTITAGQDKPIVAPREPTSLAQVGLAPLSGAGNLWNWQPQVRIEQRFGNPEMGLHAQAGVFETAEIYPSAAPAALANTLERQRPGYEGRLLFYRGAEKKRLELAPGFHFSNTHVASQSVTSQLVTFDWLAAPSDRFVFSGAFFHGTNDSGLGALRQGFTILPSGNAIGVHATGGWAQLAIVVAPRVSFHIFSGQEDNRAADLTANAIRRNLLYAGNIIYRIAPNVLTALEASQTRTDYTAAGTRINNHYDLALAYLF